MGAGAKDARVAGLLAGAETMPHLDPHYAAFFVRFDEGRFFEAHEVLEALWLRTRGGDHFFYKGLIQMAGAFVHVGRGRRGPARALLGLALKNLRPFRPAHLGLDVGGVVALCEEWRAGLERAAGEGRAGLAGGPAPAVMGLLQGAGKP